ncbi:MAG: hypothetical protein NVSMB19_08820 [Vulcanimicrobiaceae bacterium]
MREIRPARPPWDAALIVCRKCDGYDKSLRRDVKEALAAAGLRKRVRVVESSCLDVCPKRGTTVVIATPDGSDVAIVPADVRGAAACAALVLRVQERCGEQPARAREPFSGDAR